MYLDIVTAATVRLRPTVTSSIGRDDINSIVFEMATRAGACMEGCTKSTPLLCDSEVIQILPT
jgi:hypothetical protein